MTPRHEALSQLLDASRAVWRACGDVMQPQAAAQLEEAMQLASSSLATGPDLAIGPWHFREACPPAPLNVVEATHDGAGYDGPDSPAWAMRLGCARVGEQGKPHTTTRSWLRAWREAIEDALDSMDEAEAWEDESAPITVTGETMLKFAFENEPEGEIEI